MAKTIVPASPGYFILAARQDEGGDYHIDNRTRPSSLGALMPRMSSLISGGTPKRLA